jgi:Kef-type K+ transport system membrane component KefB
MTDFLQLISLIIIILAAAKLFGYLSTLLHQPAVLGELLIGVILGPTLINITHLPFITNTQITGLISDLGQIGVLLLMFLAGLELHVKDLTKNSKVAAAASLLGVALPVVGGFFFSRALGMTANESLFLGLTLGATSVSISAQVLIELNLLKSKVGLALLSTAIFDDVLVILLFSTVLAILTGGGSFLQIILEIDKMLLFFALSVAFGWWLLPRLARWTSKLPISQSLTTFALVILLVYGLASELIGGMAAITGTFIAGLMFARTPEKNLIQGNIHSIAYGFFVPLFFVSIGLSMDLTSLGWSTVWVILGISAIAILGKVIGVGSGARINRFSWRESLQLGVGMVARGEVSLIIAKIGLDEGFVSADGFTAVVAMILITALLTPPLLRAAFFHKSKQETDPENPPLPPDTVPEKENS